MSKPKAVFVAAEEGGEWLPFEGYLDQPNRGENMRKWRLKVPAPPKVYAIWFEDGSYWNADLGWFESSEWPGIPPSHEEMAERQKR